MRAAPRKVLTAAHKRAIINVMYLVFVFLNMHPKRRFLQQMFGTQSAGISPAQKANLVTALTARFVTGRGAASPALPEKTSRVKDSNSNIIGNGYLQVRILPLVV